MDERITLKTVEEELVELCQREKEFYFSPRAVVLSITGSNNYNTLTNNDCRVYLEVLVERKVAERVTVTSKPSLDDKLMRSGQNTYIGYRIIEKTK